MRIVQLITRLIRGGAQRMVLESAAHLMAAGHEVEVWTGLETGPEGDLRGEARLLGIPIVPLPHLVRAVHPARDLAALSDLTRRLSSARPDWLHTHSSKAGIVGREAAARAGTGHVAHTVHGWGFTPETPAWQRRLFVALERREMRRTDRIFFVSEGDLREGARLGILLKGDPRAEVLPPGIDLAPYRDLARLEERRAEIRGSLGIDPATPVIGYLGRLAPQKAPHLALDLLARLDLRPPPHLLVVGDGPLAPKLRRRAEEEHGLEGRVSWAGLVADPAGWYAAMDLYLLPSLWEGTPLTVMEALAAGVPVVASDLPGVRGVAGTGAQCPWASLFEPGDLDAAVALVTRALATEERREATRQAGRLARAHALDAFSAARRLARIEAAYAVTSGDTASGAGAGSRGAPPGRAS